MTVRNVPLARPFGPLPTLRMPARTRRLPLFGRDVAILLSVVGVYFLLRGVAPANTDFAVALTERIIQLERGMQVYWEPQIQDWSIRSHAVQEVANFTYAYLHFPVLAVVGAWLWWKGRERYLFARDVMFISMVIGLAFYYLLPAAPPRLMALHGHDLGFTDTVFGGETAVNYAQPSLILNEYAAIPSFHFGWIAMAAAMIWVNTENRVLRTLGVALTLLMTWAIVASANHLFFDMALGGAVVWVSWRLARRLQDSRRRAAAGDVLPLPLPEPASRAA